MAARKSIEDMDRNNDIGLAREEANQVTRTAHEISRTADQVAEGAEKQTRSLDTAYPRSRTRNDWGSFVSGLPS